MRAAEAKFKSTEHFELQGERIKEVEGYFDEGQIRKLVVDRIKAVCAKDINAAMWIVAPDIVSFDPVSPLQDVGSDALRKRVADWFCSFRGPIAYEIRDLSVATGGDVAFAHSLNRFTGTKTDGETIDMWVRATVCFRKIDGQWMITHEHSSMPVTSPGSPTASRS